MRNCFTALFILAVIAMPIPLLADKLADKWAENGWELNKNSDGIEIYLRRQADSDFKAFRAVTVVTTKLNPLVALISDPELSLRFLHNTKSIRVLEERSGNGERITHAILEVPWPVKDRDSVVHSSYSQNPEDKSITISLVGKPDYIVPQKGLVRVSKLRGFWRFEPQGGGRVRIVYQVAADPGGDLPAWLANATVVDTPYNTLKKLRALLSQPDVQALTYSNVVEP